MTLRERLDTDLKQAMRGKGQLRMDAIRMVKAALLNKEIETKAGLTDADVVKVITA
ncbi:MAG: GatB/YqeY domain-containing protein, partial [Nitrospirales bacterium]